MNLIKEKYKHCKGLSQFPVVVEDPNIFHWQQELSKKFVTIHRECMVNGRGNLISKLVEYKPRLTTSQGQSDSCRLACQCPNQILTVDQYVEILNSKFSDTNLALLDIV